MKFKVCLTGGIASGKTYVSDRFNLLGAHVIDADLLARRVVEKNTRGLAKVVENFGSVVLNKNGSLNRRILKKMVFADKRKLEVLNSILHPMIKEAFVKDSKLNRSKLEVWVIPLLGENNGYEDFDRILMVDIEESIQIKRVAARDQIEFKIARSIIDSQPSRKSRLKLATDVIVNNRGYDSLDDSIEQVFGLFNCMRNNQQIKIKSCRSSMHQL